MFVLSQKIEKHCTKRLREHCYRHQHDGIFRDANGGSNRPWSEMASL